METDMPYLHTNNGLIPEFINVNKSVGVNGLNLTEDVRFVQRALTSLYSSRYVKVSKNTGALWTKPNSVLNLDGVCDAATRQWIFKFQIDVGSQVGTDILIDGCIAPATKATSTIVYLNRILQLNYPEQHNALLNEWKPTAGRSLKRAVTQTLRIPRFAL